MKMQPVSEQSSDPGTVELRSKRNTDLIVIIVLRFTFQDFTGKNKPVLSDFTEEIDSIIQRNNFLTSIIIMIFLS